MQPDPWPTPTQLLLLRACLESSTEARSAWEQWSSIVDLDHLDHESRYLLPMLDRNLRVIGVTEHPWSLESEDITVTSGAKTAAFFITAVD
jgi:hypothetical protein